MLIPFKNIIEAFLLPPGGLVTIGALGLIFWRHMLGRLLILLSLLSLYLMSTAYFAAVLASGLESYPPIAEHKIKTGGAEAILVFMADLYSNAPELNGRDSISRLSMDRVSYAVLLYRKTGLPVILSGGINNANDLSVSAAGAEFLRNRFDFKVMAIEETSRTTWENARNSARLLKDLNIGKVALVTHAWHMPRAMYSIKRAGFEAVPAPTKFIDRISQTHIIYTLLPSGLSLRNSCHLLHEYVGLVWYFLKYDVFAKYA